MSDIINDAPHYGGVDNPYEVIKVAEAWGLDKDAYLFNVLKYIGRADKKGASLQDHKKARYYLDRKITNMENAQDDMLARNIEAIKEELAHDLNCCAPRTGNSNDCCCEPVR